MQLEKLSRQRVSIHSLTQRETEKMFAKEDVEDVSIHSLTQRETGVQRSAAQD